MSWAIQDRTLSDFFENSLKLIKITIFKIVIKLINFNRELLSSQATHRNGFVLFEIFSGWSKGWAFRGQTSSDFQKIAASLIANCSAHRLPTEMSLYSMEKYCPGDFKKYKTISVGSLWAEQFAIKVDQFYCDLKKNVKSFYYFKKSRWNRSSLIANCSAPRQPTEMVLYFLKSPGQYFSIEY